MSKQSKTLGIVLARTNFGEADRIITFLTPDHGKVKVIAKAVRKSKSKLAGGIELFSTTDIGFVSGRAEINTLTSSRLVKHYGNIVKDLDRTNAGFLYIKMLARATEDHPEPAYFHLLQEAFQSLDDFNIGLELINLWFNMQLLKLAGHAPNLKADSSGAKLQLNKTYDFNLDKMSFSQPDQRKGNFNSGHIKFLRLGFGAQTPHLLQRVKDAPTLAMPVQPLVQAMLSSHIRT